MTNSGVELSLQRALATLSGARIGFGRLARSMNVISLVNHVDDLGTPRDATGDTSTMVVRP